MATASTTNVQASQDSETTRDHRLIEAQAIVKDNMIWAMGVGVVPVPIFDLVGITAVQVKMLRKLSEHYDVPFSEHKVKNIVASLVAGLGSVGIGGAIALSVVKMIPFMGHIAGTVAIPAAAGALTYATGKVFIPHFESGGTFLDFDPVAVREHFRGEFEKAKVIVKDMQGASKNNS